MSVRVDSEDELIPRPELAAELHRTSQALGYWYRRGIGPPCILVQRQYFYRRSEVDKWLASGANTLMRGRRVQLTAHDGGEQV